MNKDLANAAVAANRKTSIEINGTVGVVQTEPGAVAFVVDPPKPRISEETKRFSTAEPVLAQLTDEQLRDLIKVRLEQIVPLMHTLHDRGYEVSVNCYVFRSRREASISVKATKELE